MKFIKPKSGEWVQPVRKGYKMMCCDCGLVHRVDFRHVIRQNDNKPVITKGGKIQFRVFRDSKSTGAARAARTKADRKEKESH